MRIIRTLKSTGKNEIVVVIWLDTAPDAGLRLQPSRSHQDNVGQAESDSVHGSRCFIHQGRERRP